MIKIDAEMHINTQQPKMSARAHPQSREKQKAEKNKTELVTHIKPPNFGNRSSVCAT